MIVIQVLCALFIYLHPTLLAAYEGSPRLKTVALVNVFLGWTVVGWVISEWLILSRREPAEVRRAAIRRIVNIGRRRKTARSSIRMTWANRGWIYRRQAGPSPVKH